MSMTRDEREKTPNKKTVNERYTVFLLMRELVFSDFINGNR